MISVSLKLFFLSGQILQGKASNFCMDGISLASSIMVNERKMKDQSFRIRPNFHLLPQVSYNKLASKSECCCPIQRPSILQPSDKSLVSCQRERLSWFYAIEEKSRGKKETRAYHPTTCLFDVKVILI